MKVLLTGGTGFLGKHLLQLLIKDERIQTIWVVSRTKKNHPHSKVQVLSLDLSDPTELDNLELSPDAVIHLAGLYDFDQDYESCYTQNVLPSLHLAQKLRRWNESRRVPLFFASTYAVTYGQGPDAAERSLEKLPSQSIPYAFTKAIAERAITDCSIPSAIFRLGILVGSSNDGSVEKLDGAYTFLKLVETVARIKRVIPTLPLPGNPEGILPLVPVDLAARVFHDALHRPEVASTPARIYGVYNEHSIRVQDFCTSLIHEFAPGMKSFYVDHVPALLLKLQGRLTPVPADAFKFALNPVALSNTLFESSFPGLTIPSFKQFEKEFYDGYRKMRSGQ